MDRSILLAMFYVFFHSSISNGQEVELFFNTPVYNGTDDYYAHIGENVTLTCTVPSTETRVYMYKGTSVSDYDVYVANGQPVSDLTNYKNKYFFVTFNGKYQLTIHNLDEFDSLYYGCRVCRYKFRRFRCRRLELPKIVVVYLDVKETTDESQIPDFCDLISYTDGIFFAGNDLTLRCPKLQFNLTACNGSFNFRLEYDIALEGVIFNVLKVRNLTDKLNGTMLSCFNVEDSSTNYCRHFKPIKVFNDLTITLSSGKREITCGENVNLTCHSDPFLPTTIEWNILERDVTYGNISELEISQGSRIVINNIEFLNFTSSLLTVICNVTIGSENRYEMSSVYLKGENVATTRVTSNVSEISSTQIPVGTEITDVESDKFISPVAIVVPITVVIILLGIIILGLVYVRVRKTFSSGKADRLNASINQDTGNVEENAYYARNEENGQLGLTNHEFDGVDSVGNVPYNEVYPKG